MTLQNGGNYAVKPGEREGWTRNRGSHHMVTLTNREGKSVKTDVFFDEEKRSLHLTVSELLIGG